MYVDLISKYIIISPLRQKKRIKKSISKAKKYHAINGLNNNNNKLNSSIVFEHELQLFYLILKNIGYN